MNKVELLDMLANGKNSVVEFRRDGLRPESLARELAALLNFEGGKILLGVDDDGSVSGLARSGEETEAWVRDVVRENVRPRFIPTFDLIERDSKVIGVIGVPADSPDKPHQARRGDSWATFVRVGSASRELSREEEERLRRSARIVPYDRKAVPGTRLEDLDRKRTANYFEVILGRSAPAEGDREGWLRLLVNTDFLKHSRDGTVAAASGLLLFGEEPHRWLPQAGITATAYPGLEKECGATDEEVIRGPLVSIFSETARGAPRVAEKGIIDRAIDFVCRNMGSAAKLRGGRRRRRKSFPPDAVREAVVNAVAHRDYALAGADIEISLYRDRLEVISPGRLPDGVTAEKMKEGRRAARNEQLRDVLRDYGYVEPRNLGARRRIIEAMREHNGTEPDLLEEEARFTVRLWKELGQSLPADVPFARQSPRMVQQQNTRTKSPPQRRSRWGGHA